MESESDAQCVICGEPATRSLGPVGSDGSLILCPLPSCEEALIEEINTALALAFQVGVAE